MAVTDSGTSTVTPSAQPRGTAAGVFAALAPGVAGAGLAGVLWVLAQAVGWELSARTVAAVAVLTVVHAGLVALAAPQAAAPVRLVLSTVLGLATAGVAVWLSGVADWSGLRWVVGAAPALAWLHPAARAVWRSDLAGDGRGRLRRYAPALWGLGLAWLLAARSLAGYFAPSGGDATWRSYYVDIPWHIALTAESLDRAPTVYPWIPDVPIGYSWLFFGTLGLLGNLTGATAAQLVLFVGPACLAVLVPAVLAGCAWVVSRSRLAALLAPLLFQLTRAPVFGHVDALQLTPQWVLINRDATNAMVASVVVLLVLRARAAGEPRRPAVWAPLLVLFLVTFAVAGSRGGAVLPVLGAAGLAWLVAVARRADDRLAATRALVVVGTAVVAATLGVTRSSGSFRFDPLSFLPVQGVAGVEFPLRALASITVALAMTGAVALVARWSPVTRPALPALIGAVLAGILGMALFGHPSFSQLYFFHAGWPALVVGLAVLLAVAVRRLGPLELVALAGAVLAAQVLLTPPALLLPTPWPTRALLAGLGALLVVGPVVAVLARRRGWRPTAALGLPALVVALQPWGLPEVVTPAAYVQPAATPATVSEGQMALLVELRELSDPVDLVATNKHCLSGSVAEGNCEARWWAVSAFAERRVLMEGWSYDYTWTSSGTDNLEPYWDQALLRANDGFIADPSPETCAVLVAEGVRWLYVDGRQPWSPRLTEYADLVGSTGDAALYRLHADCV
jgi:hypothetical protein